MKFKLFCLSLLFVISAGTICSAANTHMGVEAANLVTLEWVCVPLEGNCRFMRSSSDGSLADFDIPLRTVFVVTEFDWRFRNEPVQEGGPDDVISFELRKGILELDNSPVTSYGSTKTVSCDLLQFCKVASGTEQMTTGFVLARGSSLIPRAKMPLPTSR